MFCKVNKKALPKQGFSRSTDLLGGADDFDIDAAIRLQASNDFGALTTFALTWLRDRTAPYDLGENEFHLAFRVDDYEAAHAKHEKMGCICFENTKMGLYFIEDPDGYWLEILPPK